MVPLRSPFPMSQLTPREGHGARATGEGAIPSSAATAAPGKGAAGREGLRDTSAWVPVQVHSCDSPQLARFPWLGAAGPRLGQEWQVKDFS